MTVPHELPTRKSSVGAMSSTCLEEKFEVMKEIGDGSFGSVNLARVRTAGAHIAKRGTMVAIKTMKKTFDSFAPCLELREVIFLRSLPAHVHLVPALDIFLDPTTKKLHIAMEYMDGNLYQLMKARDHRPLDGASVKSILFQILSGLDHIHTNHFFHRDIKPENILISTSAPSDSGISFRRYSALVTPPATPPTYSVKIADFGLARETHSRLPYTTYVSTRWYRAPEVLLRAGAYSAPVDIWALGAMAVEIATLKPLFPGGNEVDQVWRVCEIMGSPGNWYNKNGVRVGGGEWPDGTKLAQKLGFSFPKMAPHSMDSFLHAPQWPLALSDFVTWCLMWDPKNRPTSLQAMSHEYFGDAVDPLMRPKSGRLLGRRQQAAATGGEKSPKEPGDPPTLSARSSWFRKSFVGRDSQAVVQPQPPAQQPQQPPQPQQQQPVQVQQVPLAPAQQQLAHHQQMQQQILQHQQLQQQQQQHQQQQQQHYYQQQQQQQHAAVQATNAQLASPRPSPVHQPNSHPVAQVVPVSPKVRPNATKRTTWQNGPSQLAGAPMPILPSIRPISPLSNAVTAEARSTSLVEAHQKQPQPVQDAPTPEKKKLGRQLSIASHGNHYGDREGGMNGGLASPTSGQKESFFSHLRKRARRFSGRNHLVSSPKYDDVETNPAMAANNRSSMIVDQAVPIEPAPRNDMTELDRALQNVRYSLDTSSQPHLPLQHQQQPPPPVPMAPSVHPGYMQPQQQHPPVALPARRPSDDFAAAAGGVPSVTRSASNSRRAGPPLAAAPQSFRYETPNEEEELLDEALHGATRAARRLDGSRKKRSADLEHHRLALAGKDVNRPLAGARDHAAAGPPALHHALSTGAMHSGMHASAVAHAAAAGAANPTPYAYPNPYPTPSPSAKRSGMRYTHALLDEPATTPIAISRPPRKDSHAHHPAFPTPPYEENEWANVAAAQIFAAGSGYR